MQVEFTQQRTIPDPILLERYARTPDIGPKILFFSGGSALQGLCRELVTYTHNSIHIITPFDSGGSSAVLRKKFAANVQSCFEPQQAAEIIELLDLDRGFEETSVSELMRILQRPRTIDHPLGK